MKKKKIVNCDGSELEVFFLSDKADENKPPNKYWKEMSGGNVDEDLEDIELEKQSIPWGDYESENYYQKLNKSFINKVKQLEQSESQIKIDDTIASDFVDLADLRNGAIYKVANLNLIAKLVSKQFDDYSALLKMSRHGTIFYVEEGSLMKATDLEVQLYLEQSK